MMQTITIRVPNLSGLKALLVSKRVWLAIVAAAVQVVQAKFPHFLPFTEAQALEGTGVLFAILFGQSAYTVSQLKTQVAGLITAAGVAAVSQEAASYPASEPSK